MSNFILMGHYIFSKQNIKYISVFQEEKRLRVFFKDTEDFKDVTFDTTDKLNYFVLEFTKD